MLIKTLLIVINNPWNSLIIHLGVWPTSDYQIIMKWTFELWCNLSVVQMSRCPAGQTKELPFGNGIIRLQMPSITYENGLSGITMGILGSAITLHVTAWASTITVCTAVANNVKICNGYAGQSVRVIPPVHRSKGVTPRRTAPFMPIDMSSTVFNSSTFNSEQEHRVAGWSCHSIFLINSCPEWEPELDDQTRSSTHDTMGG
jgi:hypothetical protein